MFFFRKHEQPLDRDALGFHTWHFLHTMAAYYDLKPSSKCQKEMLDFIHLLAKFYPCKLCSKHFRDKINRNPPIVKSRDGLTRWFHQVHNEVNIANGKAVFPLECLEERWGPTKGHPKRT